LVHDLCTTGERNAVCVPLAGAFAYAGLDIGLALRSCRGKASVGVWFLEFPVRVAGVVGEPGIRAKGEEIAS